MPRTPASNFYSLLFKRKKKKNLNLWRGENPKDVNDCNFQVKSLNLVLCAMLISVFPRRVRLIEGLSDTSSVSVVWVGSLAISLWQIETHCYFLSTLGSSCFSRSYLLQNSTDFPNYSLEKTGLAWDSGDQLPVPAPPPACWVTLKKSYLSGAWSSHLIQWGCTEWSQGSPQF